MVREIVHDPIFLARPSSPATQEDIPVADDLLETLQANREQCVGMAANMIGVSKRIIVFRDGDRDREMFNPEILSQKGPFEERKAASPCREPERQRAIEPSKSAGRTANSKPGSRSLPAGPPRSSSMSWITAMGC